MSGPIECTSMVTRIAINLGCTKMTNLAYIEGDIPDLGLDHFVHVHILLKEPDHSLSMLYGRNAIRLPNSGLQLYSCKSLTLQFDWMGEVRHNFIGPLHLWASSHGGSIADHDYTVGSPRGAPVDTGYGGGYSGYHEGGSYYTLKVTPILAPEPEPPPLPGTLTGMLL
jgi:hypothetical protein